MSLATSLAVEDNCSSKIWLLKYGILYSTCSREMKCFLYTAIVQTATNNRAKTVSSPSGYGNLVQRQSGLLEQQVVYK